MVIKDLNKSKKMKEETCVKCGSQDSDMRYDQQTDMLRHACADCGYIWFTSPLDKKSKLEAFNEANGTNFPVK